MTIDEALAIAIGKGPSRHGQFDCDLIARDKDEALKTLAACIERCKAVQEQTAAKAAGARTMAVDGANDELTRSRAWSASIAYDQSAAQLAKALEGF